MLHSQKLFSNCELSREPLSNIEIDTNKKYSPVSVLCQSGSDQHIAFAMSHHPRLGASSPARVLPPELIHHILGFVGIPGFIVTGGMSMFVGCDGVRFCPTIAYDDGSLDILGCYELPSMPCPRSGHASITLNNQLYVIGGYSHPYSLQSGSVLSLHSSKWNHIKDMALPRHGGFAAQVLGESIAVAGGRSIDCRGQVTPQAELYHPNVDKWTPLPTMLTSRYGCASVVIDKSLFVLGGSAEKAHTKSCELLDARSGKWQQMTPLPQGLSGACAALCSEYSLVLCGGALGLKDWSRDIHYLDIRKPVWERRQKALHHPRVCASALSIGPNKKVLILGGKNNYEGTESIDCDTLEVSLAPWHVPLWHHSCSVATL